MARSQRRDDEDALDPVEAADQPTDAEQDGLDGFTDVDADEEDEGGDGLDAAGAELDFDEDAEDEDLPEPADDADDDENAVPLLLPDEDLAAVVAETEDDEDEEDALKAGEFVCRSCFMAKRESALADPEAMLCRDCA